ncbi:MAG: polysaccharide deacetylase family protein [Bdellovibrionales bacterium]
MKLFIRIGTIILMALATWRVSAAPKDLRKSAEKWLAIRYQVELRHHEFSQELDKNLSEGKESSLAQSKAYFPLLSLRPKLELEQDRLLKQYREWVQLLQKSSPQSTSHQQAKRALGRLHSWLNLRPMEDRLLLSELLEELTAIQKEMGVTLSAPFDFQSLYFLDRKDLSAEFRQWNTQILARARKQKPFKKKPELVCGLKCQARLSVAPAQIEPSPGSSGNFSGSLMPNGHFAFTFDDGPSGAVTHQIVTTSTNRHVPTTFFWQVVNVLDLASVVSQTKAAGFLLNNHSWDHPSNFERLGSAGWRKQVTDANEKLKERYGHQPVIGSENFPFYRCPYGSCIFANKGKGLPEVRRLIAQAGLVHILWTVDTNDWANKKNPERTRDITVQEIKAYKRGIILMHDIWPRTPDAFNMILDWIDDQNRQGTLKIDLTSVKAAIEEYNTRKMSVKRL